MCKHCDDKDKLIEGLQPNGEEHRMVAINRIDSLVEELSRLSEDLHNGAELMEGAVKHFDKLVENTRRGFQFLESYDVLVAKIYKESGNIGRG